MKPNHLLPILLCQLCLAPAARAEEVDPAHLSPDGRFQFEAFSTAAYDAGEKPAFGIVEVSTGKLVSDPEEDLGDPHRPEEVILWAPDSLAYALTTRVGTRHLATYLYRWDGASFVRAKWEGSSQIDELADAAMRKEVASLGFSADTGLGRCIAGDGLAERWLDPRRIVLTSIQEYVAGDGQREEVVGGSARVIVKWDEASSSYLVDRTLTVREPWPPEVEDAGSFDVIQSDLGGDDPNSRIITIRNRDKGESRRFEAENWLTSPVILESHLGWPQVELISRGPTEFERRRLYRLADGDYRCVRLDDFTRLEHQAPEASQLVTLGPKRTGYLLRSRVPEAGQSDAYESFQTEFASPDGKWKAIFSYHPQYLQRAEIAAADGSGEPAILYDFDSGEGSHDTVASLVWGPDSRTFALFLRDGPRMGHSLLHRLVDGDWSQTAMPAINYDFLKEALDAKIPWGARMERPLWWNGSRELVLDVSGHFRGDEGFDYRALATLRWDESGAPAGSETRPLARSVD